MKKDYKNLVTGDSVTFLEFSELVTEKGEPLELGSAIAKFFELSEPARIFLVKNIIKEKEKYFYKCLYIGTLHEDIENQSMIVKDSGGFIIDSSVSLFDFFNKKTLH
jgi:hypothetical protein